jgi:acetoin utilization deacetylase AcuC-like enzyme
MKVGYVYDPVYLRHDTGEHPENSRRLEAIIAGLEQSGLKQRLTLIRPRPATEAELALIHHKEHLDHVKELAAKGGGWLDIETVMSSGSYAAALHAAGGAIRAVDAVMAGEVGSAFALVRPPGHHTTPLKAMGFCIFNNVAIAARYALKEHGLGRVAIIDFDVHHGNGTQEAFYDDPAVLYVSTHQYPHYPGTGGIKETGSGPAAGTNINIPLPAGCGDTEYERVFTQIIVPAVKRFRPEFILASAGFDASRGDELADMQVTVTGFAKIVSIINQLAVELCTGRLVLCLEGGYDLTAMASAVRAIFYVLLGEPEKEVQAGPPRWSSSPDIETLVTIVKKTHGLG